MQKSYSFSFFVKQHLLTAAAACLVFAGCSYSPPEPIPIAISQEEVRYLDDVKPILDKRCVTCHSCYNSPCQAKLSSFEGIDRGGSKEKVYLAERLFSQEPTRLFTDAKTTEQWRQKKFFSLTDNISTDEDGESIAQEDDLPNGIVYNNSIMGHMLYDKKQNPEVIGEYAPEYDDIICAETLEEVSEFQDKHPNHGMPYGFPALDDKEYAVIMQWLAQGAKGPNEAKQKELERPTVSAQKEIAKWETFLNTDDAKHKMTARYLYEHYILAHLNFKASPEEFYTLVRSSTPPGEKIDVIATLRAYDDPKMDTFYYRFEKIHSTIVHKTHIVVELADEELERLNELFISTAWTQEPYIVGYEDKELNANPFLVFAQIPAASRYQFMLDESEYFVRTFIRSPSCRGQIALNVIQDHFWVMFQDPRYDIGVMQEDFLVDQAQNLRMPIETGSDKKIYKVFSDSYRELYEKFYDAKMQKIAQLSPQGWPIDGIWKGRKATDSPALTVYRHFDSASVHKGTIGELPKTMWVIDYAQFERIYYALVVGFDVFGNVSHQTNVRRYMDFLRLEGEINFILYMPENQRRKMLASWYLGDAIADDIQKGRGAEQTISNSISFQTDNPKQEFIETLVDSHFIKETQIHFDDLNYFRTDESIPSLPEFYKSRADYERGLRALTAPGTGFVRHIVDNGVNVAFTRVSLKNGEELFASLVVNRWHDNVNSLFGETKRLDPSKDTLDVIRGSVGSYPNIFFDVKEEELPDFFDMLKNFKKDEVYIGKLKKYAISRSNKDFWKYFDWFQKKFYEEDPLNAGLYDLNRYYKTPWEK
jgi:hypothetical protein